MDGSVKDLAKYRLDTAKEDLKRARREFEIYLSRLSERSDT